MKVAGRLWGWGGRGTLSTGSFLKGPQQPGLEPASEELIPDISRGWWESVA